MKPDTYKYKGWLHSDRFLKRAFAVYGHAFVAGMLIAIPFYIIILTAIAISYFAEGGGAS